MLLPLYTLLLIVLVAWSSWVVFGPMGILVCMVVFACALALAYRGTGCAIVVLFVLMSIVLLMPEFPHAGEAARRAQCANQLKQIGLALHNYHYTHKQFPPAYVADKDGKPMHSWRVLILPYVEQKALYDQYDLNEPWDGPNNKTLLAARPTIYVCPSDGASSAVGATNTSYIAVVGSDAAWPDGKARSFKDDRFSGKTSSTIMVIETDDPDVNWTEPKDLYVDAREAADMASSGVKASSNHMHDNGFAAAQD